MGFLTNCPATVVSLLDSALLVKIPSMGTHDLAMLIFTLGRMKFPCSSAVSSVLVDTLTIKAPSMLNYQIAFALRGLSQMETKWQNISPEFKAHVLSVDWLCEEGSKKVVRNVAMTLDSMGLMGARWNNLSVGFHENILKVLQQVDQSGDIVDLDDIFIG